MRFPGVEREWELKRIGEVLKIGSGRDYKHLLSGDVPVFGTGGYMTSVNQYLHDGETVCIGRKGTINKPFYHTGKIWTVDTLFYTYSFECLIPRFCFNLFERINWLQFNEASGVPSLSKSTIESIEVAIPDITEQKKIAEFLFKIEKRISTQNKIIDKLKTLMQGLRDRLLTQKIRFKDEYRADFPEWEKQELGELLYYEQPTKYLVESTEYDDSYSIPVLTAGKTFILGYSNETKGIFSENLPVIIFDDFTTAIKFVDFPFKVKSSAMKILLPKKGVNIYYVFEAMKSIDYTIGGHERHWISKYSKIIIPTSCSEEQTKIANSLSSIDKKIETERGILKNYQQQLQFFLANLFI